MLTDNVSKINGKYMDANTSIGGEIRGKVDLEPFSEWFPNLTMRKVDNIFYRTVFKRDGERQTRCHLKGN